MLPEFEAGGERVRKLYEQQIQLSEFCAEMHTHGFMVDELNRKWLSWFLLEQYRQHKEKVIQLVGIPGFRATPDDMRALIFKRHETKDIHRFGLEDPWDPKMWTPTGEKISVKQDALLLLMTQFFVPKELMDIIDAYWEVCSAWKARSTFVESEKVLQSIGPDGRIRPSWNSCGADTGRFSCGTPNLMQVPQEIRYMYRAAPGYMLVHLDKEQLELQTMSYVSGDSVLRKNLDTGDVYTQDAIQIYGLDPLDKEGKPLTKHTIRKAARQGAKIGHLGFQYGAGTKTLFAQFLADYRNVKYGHVAVTHKRLKEIYCGTVAYWAEEQKRVAKCGYSESRIMRRRRTYPREPPITEVANYPIQATAADVMNIESINLWKALKKHVPSARIIAQLHDALDVECREKDVPTVRRMVDDICGGQEYLIEGRKCTFPISVKVSTHWNEV